MTANATDARPVQGVSAITAYGATTINKFDQVVVEAPLSIRINGEPVATTMRTPGHDQDLAVGWLASETDVVERNDIVKIARESALRSNNERTQPSIDEVSIELADHVQVPVPRAYLTSSSCGICSAEVLEATPTPRAKLQTESWCLAPHKAQASVTEMRAQQRMFELTGSLHAAGIASPNSELLVVREDVGRHNAVDKVIGSSFWRGQYPLTDHILVVSGRVSYEIVAKALRACFAGIIAVSGPTSLAVDLARAYGLLLVGFTRKDRLNVYSGGERIAL